MNETMIGATALMKALEKEGVKEVFGLPGGANLPMYDELGKSNIRHILVRHEQSAAHMADGFGRVSRKPGVCFATSGPGATNLLTGIATAQADSAPMVAVTGQVPVAMIGKDAFQESDIIGMANPALKYSYQPRTPEEIPTMVKQGFYIAETGRPGPVLLDIPKDVQQNEGNIPFPDEVRVPGYHPWTDPDMQNTGRAVELLLSAKKPIILAGGGVIISSAFAELQSIAELLMIPVVTTFKGKGAFPENHPLSLGPIGMHGHAEANKLMTEADCVLAIGTRFSDRSVGTFEEFEKNLKIIHMDVDPAEIGKNQTTSVAVVGDVRTSLRIFGKLLMDKAVRASDDNPWLKHVKETKQYWRENLKIHPGEMGAAKILRKLRELLPKESIVTTEVGQHQMWASLFFDAIHPGTFFSSTGLGTMGWGFPAAIGAKTARPDVPVVDIAGDGSFNMTEHSLATAVLEDLPVIVFLINNYSLGMVAQWQRTFYDRRMVGVDLKKCPDYVKLAESYGAQGIRAQSMDELEKAIKDGLNSDVATVIDIPIDPEEDVLPFVAPGTGLKDMILPS
ncbi:MAG: Acetolactate synthase large subunit [Candidatus Nitrosopelagicus brevis]|jgi:acetolactate synthase-1/2/3 large subunit|uniref:Acetolactate synthase n=1 Tax=Candidatus Nitrosopelagicus brevis TaxID=1410606 RepID=A0A0A7V782_9ARCH|nr:biosynthetic-type acetolactate synthase large subunit [Candidatus Nitrosopelagicus brevis]MCH2618342.1 biosynthetic-type acetolactate synthase large subunit [Candidatus Nitrosopelagicus sp.]MEC7707495.1 biosynthetic-type acetolactate synthase large subunit [Thermoproteota archaeon]AJA92525.1 acetolactate synthase, large subunit, biosynthetic type [Candidatus Nitrosopelagicus brevis]MEC9087209.1 biosynthetic-type acetolactate synthase large subunit [Thermoproteota archaeon]NMI83502.1 biosynt|tara:strand:- start:1738 stop:3429 length:1692 start_codon:yes stop_codon:yes gene_type:complete